MAMAEVFKLFGTIGVNTKPAEDGLDRVTEKGKKAQEELTFGQKVDKSIIGVGNSVLKVGAAVGAVALTAAAFALKGGISRALNIEDAQAKLKGLGHDAGSVDKIMANALASVKGTAFGLDAAATTAANAVAAGIKPGQQLEQVLKTVANSAAIAGTDMGSMGSIFNGVSASNKLQMDSINQLHDAGIPALQFVAKELGVTAEAASEMASAGEIDFATFERAMRVGVGDAALEMGNTTRGSWDNMLAAASRVGEAVVKDIIPKVRELFQGFTKWLDENKDTIVGFVKAFIDGFKQVVKFIDENKTLIRNVYIVITSLLIPATLTYIKLQAIAGAQALVAGAKMALGWLMAMGPIGLIVAAVVAAVALIITNWEWVSTKTTEIWTAIKDFFTSLWNGILTTLQTIWQAILDFLTLAVGIPLAIINTLLLQPLLALWDLIWTGIKIVFETVWNGMVAFLTPIIEFISNVISTALNNIKTNFTNIWNGIKSFLTPIINGIKNTISSVWNAIKSTTTSVWNAIKSAIEGPMNAAKNIVKGIIDAIKGFFSFKITWPKIPLPHFSLKPSGWNIGDLLKGKIPSLGINWYAKGGIMDSPTMFGMNGNRAMVGGEAGQEAILPLNRDTLGMIGDGIASTMGGGEDSAILAALLAEIKQLREDQKDLKVIMDSGELVGAIRKQIDKALEGDAILRRRGVTV